MESNVSVGCSSERKKSKCQKKEQIGMSVKNSSTSQFLGFESKNAQKGEEWREEPKEESQNKVVQVSEGSSIINYLPLRTLAISPPVAQSRNKTFLLPLRIGSLLFFSVNRHFIRNWLVEYARLELSVITRLGSFE
jgi:hypothetical protein